MKAYRNKQCKNDAIYKAFMEILRENIAFIAQHGLRVRGRKTDPILAFERRHQRTVDDALKRHVKTKSISKKV